MNWRKVGQIGGLFYFTIYSCAMLTPRKLPKIQVIPQTLSNHQVGTSSYFGSMLNQILYFDGNILEVVANFFFLIPIFVFFLLLIGRTLAPLALSICFALSAMVEFLQRFIPGRVSSLQDLMLNCLGALSAFLFYKIVTRANLSD